MTRFLLLLFLQVPVVRTDGGSIAGIVRSPDGNPAAGIRVAVMVAPVAVPGTVMASALIRQAQTDELGRFLMEGIEPGRYFVIAGRVDKPTYYPGVTTAAKATSLVITRGSVLKDVEFVVLDSSLRLFVPTSISGRVVLEGISTASKLPGNLTLLMRTEVLLAGNTGGTYFSDQRYRLTINSDGSFLIRMAAQSLYWLSVTGLPAGYSVRSMTFGSTDLLKEPLDSRPRTTPVPEIVITLTVEPVQPKE